MTRPFVAGAIVATCCLLTSPVSAQVLVYDAKSYLSLMQQASTALDQLNALKDQAIQAKTLYDGLNTASDVGALARQLATPALRAFMPDADAYISAASDNLADLGQIGRKA